MHKFDYQYDGNQNRTQETEFNGIDTLVTDFDYDQQDRLTTAIYAGDSQLQNNGTANYGYDDNSNRETETFTTAANVLSKNITYGYDNNDQLTSIVDSVESANSVVDYDTLGNLTQKALTQDQTTVTTNYIYDARNQLKQVQMGGSTIGAFLYDANGLRVHKTETLTDENTQIASTTQQRYHYQGLNVIGSFAKEENQSTYQANYRYYHDGNQILARINESAFTGINVESNAVQTYHQDALGSTAVISNRDGSLTARYQYDVFGNVQTETGESDSNDFTYTGHERDQATGLIYAKARYYDPQLGLFLSSDPFEGYDNTPLSLHRYLYAYQNPMKYTDPTGLCNVSPVEGSLVGCVWDAVTGKVSEGANEVVDYSIQKTQEQGDMVDTGGPTPTLNPWHAVGLNAQIVEGNPEIVLGLPLLAKPLLRANKAGKASSSEATGRIVENKATIKPAVESDVPVIDVPNSKPFSFSGGKPTLANDSFSPDLVNQRSSEFYSLYGENPVRGTLSNVDARKWYLQQEGNIPNLLDTSQPLGSQAKQAFDLRNQFRTDARVRMQDRITADRLVREETNLTFDNLLIKTENKLVNKGFDSPSSDQVFQEIINSSQRLGKVLISGLDYDE